MDPALEPLTVEHWSSCPRHEDSRLVECMNCTALVDRDAARCMDCGEDGTSWWGGHWTAPASCICDDLEDGMRHDEAERRAGWL